MAVWPLVTGSVAGFVLWEKGFHVNDVQLGLWESGAMQNASFSFLPQGERVGTDLAAHSAEAILTRFLLACYERQTVFSDGWLF